MRKIKSKTLVIYLLLIGILPACCIAEPPQAATHNNKINTNAPLKQTEKADSVAELFKAKCVSCHNPEKPSGGIDILDTEKLIQKELIDLNDPINSQLYDSVVSKRMPKTGEPLTEQELKLVLDWITELGNITQPINETIINYGNVVLCAYEDMTKNVKPIDKKDIQYFDISAQINYGDTQIVEQINDALSLALNRLNNASPHLVEPVKVECKEAPNSLYRVRMKDFSFDRYDIDQFIKNSKYMYYVDEFDSYLYDYALKELIKDTQSATTPIIRADFFIHRATQPPFYEHFLNIPNNVKELELKLLGYTTDELMFERFIGRRAAFLHSGVTHYNRIVDYFPLNTWIHGSKYEGAYWRSIDTKSDKDRRNLLAFPFGPNYSWGHWGGLDVLDLVKERVFEHDATEILYTLPNGLIASALYDGNGKSIPEADPAIASHTGNVSPSLNPDKPYIISNGSLCMACHNAGMNSFVDQGLDYIRKSSGFTNLQHQLAETVFFNGKKVYEPLTSDGSDELKYVLNQTNKLVNTATKTLNTKQVSYLSSAEPVFQTARKYNDYVTLKQLGAELGLSFEDVSLKMSKASDLARTLGYGSLTETAISSRHNIERHYGRIVLELNIGKQIVFNNGNINPIQDCYLKVVNKTNYSQRFDSIRFPTMSYGKTWLSPGKAFNLKHEGNAIVSGGLFNGSNYYQTFTNRVLNACQSYSIQIASDGKAYILKD